MDDLRPDNRAANALEATGAMGIFFGVIAIVGVFLAWLDIGLWVPPVYWGMVIAGGMLLVGVALFLIGDRWNRRCHEPASDVPDTERSGSRELGLRGDG